MKQKSICIPKILKNISYILAPILITIIVASIISVIFAEKNDKSITYANSYYETLSFKEDYLKSIQRKFNFVAGKKFEGGFTDTQETNINGKNGTIYYNTSVEGNFVYLIINKKEGIATTNLEHTMQTDNISELIQSINENSNHWNYANGEVDTNFTNLKMNNIKYNSTFNAITGTDFEVYTALLNNLPYNDDYSTNEILYNLMIKTYKMAPVIITVSLIALAICLALILKGIGISKNETEISLNWFDKWKLEIVLLIGIISICIGTFIFAMAVQIPIRTILALGVAVAIFVIYVTLIIMLETIVKRLKSHTLLKTTIIYSIFKGAKSIIDNRNITIKLILFYGLFCILGFFFTARMLQTRHAFIYAIFLLSLGFLSFWYLFCKLREFEKIREALKSIYEGNTNISLNPNEQKGVLKELSIYIQDIAGGLSNAVNQSLKSERLKTELITNVSHDIKTPLTSIINYVDLLKKGKNAERKMYRIFNDIRQ